MIRKTRLLTGAASAAILLSAVGMASAQTAQLSISQILNSVNNNVSQVIDNTQDVSVNNSYSQRVDIDGVMSKVNQTALNSINTIGAAGANGAVDLVSVALPSADPITGDALATVDIQQIIDNVGGSVDLNIAQTITNTNDAQTAYGDSVAGGSQLGLNTLNQLFANVDIGTGTINVDQEVDVDFGASEDSSDFEQSVTNRIMALTSVAGTAAVDGTVMGDNPATTAIETNFELNSTQLGSNTQNSLSLTGVDDAKIFADLNQIIGSSIAQPSISNLAVAYAPQPLPSTPSDPLVTNLDQVALTTLNQMTFGSDVQLFGDDAGSIDVGQFYSGLTENDDDTFESGPLALNQIVATSLYDDLPADATNAVGGAPAVDGIGNVNIADSAQTILTRINNFDADAAVTFEDSFTQRITDLDFDGTPQNFALASTGTDNAYASTASIDNLDQTQLLNLNQFAAGSVSGFSSTLDTDDMAQFTQELDGSTFGDTDVDMSNLALVEGRVGNMDGVAQTILMTANTMAVDGAIDGGIGSAVSGPGLAINQLTTGGFDTDLDNTATASNAGLRVASLADMNQTILSTVNSITAGSLDGGSGAGIDTGSGLNITQSAIDVSQDLTNTLVASASVSASITGATQTALNRVNAITASVSASVE